MPTTFRDYHPDQPIMMPPDVREWLPADDLCYQVSDLVDAMDLAAFYAPYAGDGRRNRPYEPALMVKLLLYGYAVGVFSSRRIERALQRDVGFRYLAAGNLPRHRTICEFRRRHLDDFKDLFVQVVRVARELGLTKLGTLAIDSSKVKASASRRKAMTYSRMLEQERKLREEIAGLLERAEAIDAAEDELYGEDSDGGDEIPEELRRRSDRLQAIAAAKQRLEEKARRFDEKRGRKPGQKRNPRGGAPYKRPYGEPDPGAQHNFTDPESSIMNTSTEGFQQAYNAQAAVDGESRLIVAVDVTGSASDAGQLANMLERTGNNTGLAPAVVLADSVINVNYSVRFCDNQFGRFIDMTFWYWRCQIGHGSTSRITKDTDHARQAPGHRRGGGGHERAQRSTLAQRQAPIREEATKTALAHPSGSVRRSLGRADRPAAGGRPGRGAGGQHDPGVAQSPPSGPVLHFAAAHPAAPDPALAGA